MSNCHFCNEPIADNSSTPTFTTNDGYFALAHRKCLLWDERDRYTNRLQCWDVTSNEELYLNDLIAGIDKELVRLAHQGQTNA